MSSRRIQPDIGGAAFPVAPGSGYEPEFGMSLLDYFAGQGILAQSGPVDYAFDGLASDAYRIATAMLAEKRRREGRA